MKKNLIKVSDFIFSFLIWAHHGKCISTGPMGPSSWEMSVKPDPGVSGNVPNLGGLARH